MTGIHTPLHQDSDSKTNSCALGFPLCGSSVKETSQRNARIVLYLYAIASPHPFTRNSFLHRDCAVHCTGLVQRLSWVWREFSSKWISEGDGWTHGSGLCPVGEFAEALGTYLPEEEFAVPEIESCFVIRVKILLRPVQSFSVTALLRIPFFRTCFPP